MDPSCKKLDAPAPLRERACWLLTSTGSPRQRLQAGIAPRSHPPCRQHIAQTGRDVFAMERPPGNRTLKRVATAVEILAKRAAPAGRIGASPKAAGDSPNDRHSLLAPFPQLARAVASWGARKLGVDWRAAFFPPLWTSNSLMCDMPYWLEPNDGISGISRRT